MIKHCKSVCTNIAYQYLMNGYIVNIKAIREERKISQSEELGIEPIHYLMHGETRGQIDC